MKKVSTICIIDDDEIYTAAIKKMIERYGLANKVLVFANGRLAMNFFHQILSNDKLLPDLILLDLNMPVLDGWNFLLEYEAIKKTIAKEIQLYIVSSSIMEEDQKKAEKLDGVAEFIRKPFDLVHLIAILDKV